ncbi:hypothetical protein EIK77_007934 [Talaromyces pinophilus]|nr:hypothetical protein EIK77_007934 [Talaromyces pinophilus]PCG93891.1 hypothetical protein PENOC_085370 [Penicillium occitanis (nom. inval.)]PCG95610.1 Hypothetical protein PENO1_072750 [Penicillium occitanis (nom. inval.)]
MADLFSVLRRHSVLTATSVIIAALSIPAYRDYQVFISYGPGGPPHNALGWFFSRFLATPFGQEMFSTAVYERRILAGENTSYLNFAGGQLPQRDGETPAVGPHVVPQRQIDQISGRDIQKVRFGNFPTLIEITTDTENKQDFVTAFYALASKNSHIIKIAPSNAEKHSDAMWLLDNIPRAREAFQTGGEVAHIHETGDHSLHVVLSPADAKKVIEAGWGQRHALSGWRPLGGRLEKIIDIPATYLLIYTPRTSEETEIVLEIVKATMRHMSMGAEVIS